MTALKPWAEYTAKRSERAVHPPARTIAPAALVDIAESIAQAACSHALIALPAYAQATLLYDAQMPGGLRSAPASEYASAPRTQKLNKFGAIYRADAKIWLHETLATITLEAGKRAYAAFHTPMLICDGLRTVEAAYLAYQNATDEERAAGLLALPGESAHNKALAVDVEFPTLDFGTTFDDAQMELNHRNYNGHGISLAAKQNRLCLEAAFLGAAFHTGSLLAPLRREWWDFRLPEDRSDLWRVIESAARIIGEPEIMARAPQLEFSDYAGFRACWKEMFSPHKVALNHALGCWLPPEQEKPEFYHGNYNPLYDAELRAHGKHLTDMI